MRKYFFIFTTCLLVTLPAKAEKAPREQLLSIFSGDWVARGVYVAAKLKVADYLASGPKNITELAHLAKADPDSLERLLHMLEGYGVFQETAPGVFTNTRMSEMLNTTHPGSLHSLAIFYGEDIHKALEKLLPSIEEGRPAFEIAFQEPVFGYFKSHPTRAALFQEAMKAKSRAVIQSTLSTFDFTPFQKIYDIGGGHGQLLDALVNKHPHLSATLFELPEVIQKLKGKPSPYAQESGDFFTSVPEGGDLYILKSVLHDWDDAKAEIILKNCHRAMQSNSRLLISEVVLQPGDLSVHANCMDLLMLAITGGKERSLATFEKILDRSGFVLEKIYSTSTEFSLLQARSK